MIQDDTVSPTVGAEPGTCFTHALILGWIFTYSLLVYSVHFRLILWGNGQVEVILKDQSSMRRVCRKKIFLGQNSLYPMSIDA